MLIRHLSFFVTLAEEKHFARAAELCHITQPTLSAAIRKLEDDLRVTLIARGNRYIGLTPDGERALEWGRQILFDYDSLQKDITGSKKVFPARCGWVSFPPRWLRCRFCPNGSIWSTRMGRSISGR
ncbi:LysR family transcriptional regulator [Rhizobium sp. RCAM05973]|uniref:LysR family transcriptional regulator n=1 Tax=Rhizobium sp. RCAM05973 TaxID=2994066 RepID=UPI0032B7BAC4